MPANLENSAVVTRLEKSVFIAISKKGSAKKCSNYPTVALISHASKVMLKNLQAKLQQYVNWEIPNVQADFRKGRRTRYQIANIHWIIETARDSRKTSTVSLTTLKAFDCVDDSKLENSYRDGNTLPVSWETCMEVKKQQLELDMEQWTASKWERSTTRLYTFTLFI